MLKTYGSSIILCIFGDMEPLSYENSILTPADEETPVSHESAVDIYSGTIFRVILLQRNGKRFIFKCLNREYAGAPQFVALLRKEYDLGMKLDHPNIVRMINYETNGQYGPGILMEWIDGMTLNKYLAENPPESRRMSIMRQLAEALAYIHSRGVSHRDLKPDNILITRRQHEVRLIDLGLGDADDQLTVKMSAATTAYGAPEQLAGIASDERADVYSFGKIMAQAGLPRRFMSLSGACLHRDPDRRPSMDEVVRRINRLIAHPIRRIMILAAVIVTIAALAIAFYHSQTPPPIEESETTDAIIEKSFVRVDSLVSAYAPAIESSGWDGSRGGHIEKRTAEMFALAADLEAALREKGLSEPEIADKLAGFWLYSVNTTNKSDGLQ